MNKFYLSSVFIFPRRVGGRVTPTTRVAATWRVMRRRWWRQGNGPRAGEPRVGLAFRICLRRVMKFFFLNVAVLV